MASRGTLGTFQTSDGYGKFAFTSSGIGSDLTLQKGNTIYSFNSNISESVQNLISNISYTNSAIPAAYPGYIPLGVGITPTNPFYSALLGPISYENSPLFATTNSFFNALSPVSYPSNLPVIGGYINPGFNSSLAITVANSPNWGFGNVATILAGQSYLCPPFDSSLPLSDSNYPVSRSLPNSNFVPGAPPTVFSTASYLNSPLFTYNNRSFNPFAAISYPANLPIIGGFPNPAFDKTSPITFSNLPNFGIPNPSFAILSPITYLNYPLLGLDAVFENGQRSNVFTPCMAVNYWKNDQEFEVYNGIQNSGSATPVSNTTIFPFFSDSKCVTAMMYSRMKTLGIIPTVKRVDEIFPNMKGVRWSTTTLSTTKSNVATDFTGSNTQTQYKLASDVYSLPWSINPTLTEPGYKLLSSGNGISNAYIHVYDFDATVQAMYKAANIASINTTYVYSNTYVFPTGYKQVLNSDFLSNITEGRSYSPSGTPLGDIGAIAYLTANCFFTPVMQSFQYDPYGSVRGDVILDKLKQSNLNSIATATSNCNVAKGYGFNIFGPKFGPTTSNINIYSNVIDFLTSANAFVPVFTTQYAAKVSNVTVNSNSYAKYGGILDGPFSVHPGAIPPGVIYTQNYPANTANTTFIAGTYLPFANIAPPNQSLTSNLIYSPVSTSNLYINTSDATRPLYLDDVFSESSGFACGFEQFYFGNGTYGGVWGASNNTYTSNVLYNPGVETLKTYGLNVVSELARSSVCLASNTAPINHVLDGTSNVSFCTSNLIVLPQYLVSQNAVATFNNFVNNFQGRTYVQTLPHGIFNYNSSGFIGTACMELLYNQYYGTSNTYYEILKKELLDPVGSNLVYISNSSDMSTVWAVDPSASNPLLANQYYVPSSSPSNPEVGLDYTSPTSFARLKTVQFNNAPVANRLYFGNYGLCGTLKDLSKVLRIFARKGLDQNGNVLISENDLMNCIVPRNSLADYVGAQNYFPNSLALLYGSIGSTYGLGGCAVGPSYSDYTTVEPSLQMQSFPQGREIRNLVNTSLNVSWVIPVPFAVPAFLWSGLGGSSHSIGINEQFVTTSATMESQSEFAGMIQSALGKYVGNDIVNPKSNCLVYTSSSVPVPYIPEPAGGGK